MQKTKNVLHIVTREPVDETPDIVEEYQQRAKFPWFWFIFGMFVLTCL